MATHLSSLPLFLFFLMQLLLNLPSNQADLILEEGYTVTTVMEGHKLKINPRAVLSRPQSSDLILLDSSRSIFYTVSFPISQESVIKRLSGDGVAGLSDGEASSARFNKPRSFTADNKGNIYVADRINGTIRKITNSGVSTIAGGYSKGVGREDGNAQNATFSSDFEVAFVAEECALLISDHGNQLLRRLALKHQDCATASQSALGAVSFCVIGFGLVLSCLIGIVIGFVIRPHQCSNPLGCSSSGTWRLCLINLAKPVLKHCFDIRNAIARSSLYALLSRLLQLSLSHLSLTFRINTVGPQTSSKGFASLLDSDINSLEPETAQLCAKLKDLISFNDGPLQLSNCKDVISNTGERDQLRSDDVSLDGGNRRIDSMIQANVMGFAKVAEERTTSLDGTLVESRCLVKRK